MAYSGPDDIRKLFRTALTFGVPEDAIPLIELSDAEIDALLGARWAVPFAATPEATPAIIRKLSAIGAALHMFSRSAQGLPAWVEALAEWRQRMLAALADGTATVPGAGDSTDALAITSSLDGYVPTFGAAPSLSERVDPQRAEDEENARG